MSQDVTEPSSSTEPQLSAIEQIVAALAIEIGILQGVGAEGSAAALIEITNMVNRLCFSDCVNHFGRNPTKEETALIEAAKEKYESEGSIEIDDTTICSGSGDDGDYIMGWLWVYNNEAGLPSGSDDNEDDGPASDDEADRDTIDDTDVVDD